MSASATPCILLYCRAGFEKECAQDITQAAARLEINGWCKANPDSGFVLFHPAQTSDMGVLKKHLQFHLLSFARQMIFANGPFTLATENRLPPLLAAVQMLKETFNQVWLETADTNAAKELSGFCRKLNRI